MITWQTRISWRDSARDLETPDLVQQTEDALEILKVVVGIGSDRTDLKDPGVWAWIGYPHALIVYIMQHGMEQIQARGIACEEFFKAYYIWVDYVAGQAYVDPPWRRDVDLMRAHRSNLARRSPERYKNTWPKTPVRMPFIWPKVDGAGGYKLLLSKVEKEMLISGERSLPGSIHERIDNR